MIAYVDASVLLRVALGQPNALREWREVDRGVSSALNYGRKSADAGSTAHPGNLPDSEIAGRRATVLRLIASLEIVEITSPVLARAAQPMPTQLGTPDAIHLAPAVL
jgi:predicted nucleic acid-binding protein